MNRNVKKLFLLDAYALIYRSYYAFIRNPIKNPSGFNTSTIFGFINTLEEILKKENPSHIAVAFDPSTPTFRKDMYPEYKANREEMPEDIRNSIPWIKKVIEAYNIPILEIERYEADDVIGTLAKQAEKEGYTVYLMTPDKDFAQLVSENVFMYKPKKSGNEAEKWGIEEVKERFGIDTPDQVIDILALWGDSSDNVPGVPGIGEKTAKKLIAEYKRLENIFDNLEKFKGKQKENLSMNIEQALLSKKLVTIDLDVPVDFDGVLFERKDFNKEELKKLFEALDFKVLSDRILGDAPESASASKPSQGDLFSDLPQYQGEQPNQQYNQLDTEKTDYQLIEKQADMINLTKLLEEKGIFCFDTETSDLDVNRAELVGIAFSIEKQKAYYLPVSGNKEQISNYLKPVKKILENQEVSKVGQNLKFDIRILKKYNIETSGMLFDTMIAHYLLQPEQRHSLNTLAETYLNYSPVKIEELIGKKGKKQGNMKNVKLETIKDYACEDADVTWQLYELFSKELSKNHLQKLAREIEMPLIYVLANMEHAGVKLDFSNLGHFAEELKEDIRNTEDKIYQLADAHFNIASPKQLGDILFNKMKIVSDAKRTKTKQYSTSEEVLTKLIDKHEIIPEILTWRSLNKLLNTYVEALPKLINERTGRIHTSFNQTVAATGRLSSNNPNLQNIPIRLERGREIRKAFVSADMEHVLVAADYSQIELRLMAHLSGDNNLIEAFNKDLDIHAATASKIYNVTLDQVSREMRSSAKTANFGIIYGISAFGLSQRLNISRKDAKKLIDDYFESFPGVKQYMEESIEKARKEGCVYTIKGRKRFLPDINSRNSIVRGIAERNAINAPIQGSAADIIKIAMINIDRIMKENNFRSFMILQVHDELVFDVHRPELDKMKRIIRNQMENAVRLNVPLTVDVGEGENWFAAH